jgi:glycosyltransferase involved in cell wall biosynthesis
MNVLFYLLDGASNASSFHRALQFFPALRERGIQPQASTPVAEPLYQRLVERGSFGSPQKALFYGLFLTRRLRDVLAAERFDVVVIQRDLFPFGPPLLERLLAARNPALVYDTDDATYLRPAFTPSTVFQRLRRFDKVADVVRRARWVSVATESIASWARRYNTQVSVVPMAVDPRMYAAVRARCPRPGHASPVVLGWMGTRGGLRYLEALGPVLRDLAQRYPLVVRVISGGYQEVQLADVPFESGPWRGAASLEDAVGFDVGLVPLDDTPFERAKFPAKLLQFMALGVPSVCARVGATADVVHDGEDALLASTPAEWRAQIERAICDGALRSRIADAALATVEARYTLDRVAPLLEAGLRSAVRTAVSPSVQGP